MNPLSAPPLFTALPHWGVVMAEGADTATFLHGQLTQDVAAMPIGSARLAAYCSPKGRVLAVFIVAHLAEARYALLGPAEVLNAAVKRLRMFVLRAKCTLSAADEHWQVQGWLAGELAQPQPLETAFDGLVPRVLAKEGGLIQLAQSEDNRAAMGIALVAKGAEPQGAASAPVWAQAQVASALPLLQHLATQDLWVPQMLNLELIDGVHFQKGCYPGQEVVARSQYRGVIKRRTVVMTLSASATSGQALVDAASPVFHDSDPSQPAGAVVQACHAPGGGQWLQVEVKQALLPGGTWRLGSPLADAPVLLQRAMPYAFPPVADAS